jgi:hypothetical protein
MYRLCHIITACYGWIRDQITRTGLMHQFFNFVNPTNFPRLAPLCGPQSTPIDCLSFSFSIPVFKLCCITLETERNLFSLYSGHTIHPRSSWQNFQSLEAVKFLQLHICLEKTCFRHGSDALKESKDSILSDVYEVLSA